jgi:hypothetical protein
LLLDQVFLLTGVVLLLFFFVFLLIVFSRPKWLSFVLLRARGCLNPAYSVRFIEQNFISSKQAAGLEGA